MGKNFLPENVKGAPGLQKTSKQRFVGSINYLVLQASKSRKQLITLEPEDPRSGGSVGTVPSEG